MTAVERESMYSRKEVRKALEAGEFTRSLGYPSEKEAVEIVRNGNVTNILYCVDDIWRFFDIYGQQIPALHGKMTNKHPTRAMMFDSEGTI
jgi:hypothetical protein